MPPASSVIPYTRDELADLVWARTGKTPTSIRCQALLVIAEFDDGQMSVHRVEELEQHLPQWLVQDRAR